MAAIGNIVVNAELHGSAVRVRALELAVETMKDMAPASSDAIVARAEAFEKFVTGA